MKLFAIELHRDNVRLDLCLGVSTVPRIVDKHHGVAIQAIQESAEINPGLLILVVHQ